MRENHIVYAKATRQYLDDNYDSIDLPWIWQFPLGCCETASILLGIVIKKIHPESEIIIVKSERKQKAHGRHFWTEIEGATYDLTADQFGSLYQPQFGEKENSLLDMFEIYERSRLIQEISLNGWTEKLEEFDEVATKIISKG